MAEAAEEKVSVPVVSGVPWKLVIIIAVATLLIGLGGAFALFRMTTSQKTVEDGNVAAASTATKSVQPEAETKKGGHGEPGAMADLEPFIVNLADAPEIRYLKLTVKLELDHSGATEEVKLRTPQIRDSILVLLTSKDSGTIRTPQGKAQLRDEITQRVNGLLPKAAVRSAYFTEFVIQ
jgi:flagellar FliL protein